MFEEYNIIGSWSIFAIDFGKSKGASFATVLRLPRFPLGCVIPDVIVVANEPHLVWYFDLCFKQTFSKMEKPVCRMHYRHTSLVDIVFMSVDVGCVQWHAGRVEAIRKDIKVHCSDHCLCDDISGK